MFCYQMHCHFYIIEAHKLLQRSKINQECIKQSSVWKKSKFENINLLILLVFVAFVLRCIFPHI